MNITRKQFFQLTPQMIADPRIGWRYAFFGLLRISEDLFRSPAIR